MSRHQALPPPARSEYESALEACVKATACIAPRGEEHTMAAATRIDAPIRVIVPAWVLSGGLNCVFLYDFVRVVVCVSRVCDAPNLQILLVESEVDRDHNVGTDLKQTA